MAGKKARNMKMDKKGQAAFEMIHTYGWVMLTILVLGGLLVYYGLSNPQRVLPTGCTFNSGIDCLDISVEDTLLTINIVNGFGFGISNITASIQGTCNSTANTTDGNPYSNPNVLLENDQDSIVFECQNLSKMDVEGKIIINYVNVESGQQHQKAGRFKYEKEG